MSAQGGYKRLNEEQRNSNQRRKLHRGLGRTEKEQSNPSPHVGEASGLTLTVPQVLASPHSEVAARWSYEEARGRSFDFVVL